MRRLFLVVILFLTLSQESRSGRSDRDETYVDAYQLVLEGDGLAANGDRDRANEKYHQAQEALKSNFRPAIRNGIRETIEFRLRLYRATS